MIVRNVPATICNQCGEEWIGDEAAQRFETITNSPENLDSPETICYWTGKTQCARFIYLPRHNQQHIGDINRVLATCGCKALQWY